VTVQLQFPATADVNTVRISLPPGLNPVPGLWPGGAMAYADAGFPISVMVEPSPAYAGFWFFNANGVAVTNAQMSNRFARFTAMFWTDTPAVLGATPADADRPPSPEAP
jgi:hypothetical protein